MVSGLASLFTAYLTDRMHHRFAFAEFGYVLSHIGFVILLTQQHVSRDVKYMALYFVEAGSYITQPLLWSMMANNVSGKYKLAIASGLQIGLGNSGGIITSLVFPATQAPLYQTGFAICLGLLVFAALLMIAFVVSLSLENGLRVKGGRDEWLQLPAKEIENLGDDHPKFRFVY